MLLTAVINAAAVVVCVPHARLHTNFSGGLVLFFVLCIYTEEKPEIRKEKNTPTTPTAAELAPPHYGRYRALLTFLELLMWAGSEATTATDRYPNGRASPQLQTGTPTDVPHRSPSYA